MNIFLFPKSTAFYPIVWVLSTKSKHQFQSSSIHKTECSKIHHTHTTLKIESSLVFSICESLFKRSNTRWSKPISCISLCFEQQQRITHELKALQLDKGGWYSDLKQKHFPLLKAKINLHKETEQEAKHSTKQVWHPTVNEICLKKKNLTQQNYPSHAEKKKSSSSSYFSLLGKPNHLLNRSLSMLNCQGGKPYAQASTRSRCKAAETFKMPVFRSSPAHQGKFHTVSPLIALNSSSGKPSSADCNWCLVLRCTSKHPGCACPLSSTLSS